MAGRPPLMVGIFLVGSFFPPQCEREIDMLETWGTWWNTKAEASSLMLPYVSLRFQISALTNRLPNPTPSDFQLGKMSVVMVDKDGERPQCPNHGRLFLCGEGTIWIIICSLFDKPSGEWLFYQRHCARSNFQLGRLSLCQGQAQAQAHSQAQAQAQSIDRMEDAAHVSLVIRWKTIISSASVSPQSCSASVKYYLLSACSTDAVATAAFSFKRNIKLLFWRGNADNNCEVLKTPYSSSVSMHN